MKNIFLMLMLCASVFAANTISVSSVADDGAGMVTFSLDYMFDDEVGGFQFDLLVEGIGTALVYDSVSGGDAAVAFNSVTTNSSGTMLGFSFTGGTMAAETSGHFMDVMATYDVTDVAICATIHAVEDCTNGQPACSGAEGDTRMVLSDSAGQPLESSFTMSTWTVGSSCGTTDTGDCACSGDLDNDISPYEFGLSKNYPNPFNPTTTIGYDIKAAGEVSIVIYDMTGREVRNLVSDYANPGSYSVVWNAKSNQGLEVSAGMYVYKMIAGDFVQVNKMLLVK